MLIFKRFSLSNIFKGKYGSLQSTASNLSEEEWRAIPIHWLELTIGLK